MENLTLQITIDKKMAIDILEISKAMPIDSLKRYNGTDIIAKYSDNGVYFFESDEIPARINSNVYKYLSYDELIKISNN